MGRERKFTRTISVRVPYWVYHYLENIAEEDGVTVAEVTRRFLKVLALPNVSHKILKETIYNYKIPPTTIGNMERVILNSVNTIAELAPAFRLILDLNEKFKSLRGQVKNEYAELLAFFEGVDKRR
ncbi:MAG: hypothetical protein GWN56_00090, partial [Nitrosopumilaceae archaeon]|nr:hypothetical protein [Nitrosopumilaceae archaeon]